MNRERLKTLRDHLAGLPDERVQMRDWVSDANGAIIAPFPSDLRRVLEESCGTAACIAGWASFLFGDQCLPSPVPVLARDALGLSRYQSDELFRPAGFADDRYTRSDAIAAIDSMLANPDDLALPVWPKKAVSA